MSGSICEKSPRIGRDGPAEGRHAISRGGQSRVVPRRSVAHERRRNGSFRALQEPAGIGAGGNETASGGDAQAGRLR